MTRYNITAHIRSRLCSRKYKEFVQNFNPQQLGTELEKINGEYCSIQKSKYLEDYTNEVRDLTVIEIGLPVQAEICFYL